MTQMLQLSAFPVPQGLLLRSIGHHVTHALQERSTMTEMQRQHVFNVSLAAMLHLWRLHALIVLQAGMMRILILARHVQPARRVCIAAWQMDKFVFCVHLDQ